jgi:dihydroorotate dehydrogenase (NAD+) catalytic subunit
MVVLAVDLAPQNPRELRLANPIMAASGCYGFGMDLAGLLDVGSLGAFISPSLTVRARKTDRRSWLVPTPGGVLYANTLPNPGLRSLLRTYPRIWERWTVPVIASIAGESADEFATIAETLDEVAGVSGLEINLSLPMRGEIEGRIGDDPDRTFAIVEAVRTSTSLPVIAKLNSSPLLVVESARAAQSAGADAISLVNAVEGLVIDSEHRRPAHNVRNAFLAGPAIKPIVLRQVFDVAASVPIPVIGGGGIASLDDALEFLMAGASAIQIGSAIFTEPALPERLVNELTAWMTTRGIAGLDDLVGVAQVVRRDSEETMDDDSDEVQPA